MTTVEMILKSKIADSLDAIPDWHKGPGIFVPPCIREVWDSLGYEAKLAVWAFAVALYDDAPNGEF